MNFKESLFSREVYLLIRNRWITFMLILLIVGSIFNFYTIYVNAIRKLNFISSKSEHFLKEYYQKDVNKLKLLHSISSLHPSYGVSNSLIYLGPETIILILSVIFVASEFGWKTVRPRSVHDGWSRVVSVKILLLIIFVLFSIFLTITIGIITNNFFWSRLLLKINDIANFKTLFPNFPQSVTIVSQPVVMQFTTIFLIGLFYASLGVLLALLLKKSIASILIVYLMDTFTKFILLAKQFSLPEWLLSIALHKAHKQAFSYLTEIRTYNPYLDTFPGNNQPLSVQPLFIIIIYIMLFLILIFLISRKQEI